MARWRCYIYGRKAGAIGVFYNVVAPFVVEALTEEAARLECVARAGRDGYEVHHVRSIHKDSD